MHACVYTIKAQEDDHHQIRMSHIAVERNRRRQMNGHLKVLQSLTPSFHIKKGDQASIVGGVIDFIRELHQVLESLESQKRRKSMSPIVLQQLSPHQPNNIIYHEPLSFDDHGTAAKQLVACCSSPVADVEAKVSGSNVILRTVSRRIPGQLLKVICLLERQLDLEILHLNVSSMEDAVLYSFVIKIGLECKWSVEDLALEVEQSFKHEHAGVSIIDVS